MGLEDWVLSVMEKLGYLGIAFLMFLALYTTNFTEPLSYQGSAFLKLPKFP